MPWPGSPESRRAVCRCRRPERPRQLQPTSGPRSRTTGSSPRRLSSAADARPAAPPPITIVSTGGFLHHLGAGALLFLEEAVERPAEEREEDDGLLDGHGHARDLLVGERRDAPGLEAAGVVVVGGVRYERHDQPDRARERERKEEVAGAKAIGKTPVEDRPPDEDARREVRDVLEVQEGVVLERRVVRRREVPERI